MGEVTASQDTTTRLQLVLDEQGRKQNWLAAQIGARPDEVSAWCRGLHVPRPSTRARIEDTLGRRIWPDTQEKAA